MAGAEAKKSDLPARVASAVVMVAVAGSALWLGGWAWSLFVAAVALGVLWEWIKLANAITAKLWARALWLLGGVVYIGVAALWLNKLNGWMPGASDRKGGLGILTLAVILLVVIATDVGAYFCGRFFGGPKIAPSISPSKTWAGLAGGMLASAVLMQILAEVAGVAKSIDLGFGVLPISGAVMAVVAQVGDFFESWMKRRAGVKDSGKLLPGHGGLFDRADGFLAVSVYSFAMNQLHVVPFG